MIYVTSDLHGAHPEVMERLLEKAGFGDGDFLFVLGDVIDRGDHGIDLLLWLTQLPNAQLILGNHEAMMCACRFLFEEVTEESLEKLTLENLKLMQTWVDNGGTGTIQAMKKLLKADPGLAEGIWEYLDDAPLYDVVAAGGKTYILTHAGLGNFSPHRPTTDYTPEELLMHRPSLSDRYFPDATVIFGHTPTQMYGMEYAGKALRTDTWIDIDTGAAAGGNPMLLRLDDAQEFYL